MKLLSKTKLLYDMQISIIYSWKSYPLKPAESWKLVVDATGILAKIPGDKLPITWLASWQESYKGDSAFYRRLDYIIR